MIEEIKKFLELLKSDERLKLLNEALVRSFENIKPQFYIDTNEPHRFTIIEPNAQSSIEIAKAIVTYYKVIYEREIGLINL